MAVAAARSPSGASARQVSRYQPPSGWGWRSRARIRAEASVIFEASQRAAAEARGRASAGLLRRCTPRNDAWGRVRWAPPSAREEDLVRIAGWFAASVLFLAGCGEGGGTDPADGNNASADASANNSSTAATPAGAAK